MEGRPSDMAFFLLKLLKSLTAPPASLLLLIAAGLLVRRRRPRLGGALVLVGLALLYLLALPPVADRLVRPLETAEAPAPSAPGADAVVVLGGGVRDLSWLPAPAEPSEGSLERLVAGVALARSLDLPLVILGGTGEPLATDAREADAMASLAARLGFPRERLLRESASRSTRENAAALPKVISGRSIVLVTSAFHLPRAAALFRKQGFSVFPAPAAFRAEARPWTPMLLVPTASSLSVSAVAISEYLALAWSTLTGQL